MILLVNKFSNGKYVNDYQLYANPISEDTVKLMGEIIALQAIRTAMKFDYAVVEKLYNGYIKDLHHMHEPEYIISDGYDCAQIAMCFLWQYNGRNINEVIDIDKTGKPLTIKHLCYREVDAYLTKYRRKIAKNKAVDPVHNKKMPIEPVNFFNKEDIDYDKPDKIIKAIPLNDLEIKTVHCYMRGITQLQIALELGITVPAVKYRRMRAREMYASGISPLRIAEIFNKEGIPSPGRVAFLKLGRKYNNNEHPLWEQASVRILLKNIAYIGHLAQQKYFSISYKNHKVIKKDPSDWVIIENSHEPIISQELWDKVQARIKSQSHGRSTALGYTHPLSGFLYCADCGSKMKMGHAYTGKRRELIYNFNCGDHRRFGRTHCFSHFIPASVVEEIVLGDIQTMAQRIILDEDAIKKEFIQHNAELMGNTIKTAKKTLTAKQKRMTELSRLIQVVYEDRVSGKMPESICFGLIEKYSTEQQTLTAEIEELENTITKTVETKQASDDFIQNIKKYLNAPKLTREMCYELIDRIVIGGLPKYTGKERIAVIYARYSSDKQTEQSIDGQLRVCQEYAQRNDIVIVDTYIDRAMTGTNDDREAFQKMLSDSDKKEWDYVLVFT